MRVTDNACTVVCATKGYRAIAQMARQISRDTVSIQGTDEEWTTIRIRSGLHVLTFTSLVRIRPGDRFSKLVLGMYSFFRQIDTFSVQAKQTVLDTISQANMLIGVVVEPGWSDREEDYVFEIAKCVDGMVFTGHAMLDSHGSILLDSAGKSDAP